MNARVIANQSIPWLYGVSLVLLFAVFVRLFFEFKPQIDVNPETKPSIRAPFLAIPNIGPIAREAWLEKTLRECLSFTSRNMESRLNQCAIDYFDIRAQDSLSRSVYGTTFGRILVNNPQLAGELQTVNTQGPFMIFEGVRSGLPAWRFQTEIMQTLFLPDRTLTKRLLIDATITFDTPDALFFSGFRYLTFFMKERN